MLKKKMTNIQSNTKTTLKSRSSLTNLECLLLLTIMLRLMIFFLGVFAEELINLVVDETDQYAWQSLQNNTHLLMP